MNKLHKFKPGDFVQHVISREYGFVWTSSDPHWVVILLNNLSEGAVWSFDRVLPADRKPTDKEWASYCAYQLTN